MLPLSAPGSTGSLPDIIGSQGLFSPAAASADLTAEAAFPATGGGLAPQSPRYTGLSRRT